MDAERLEELYEGAISGHTCRRCKESVVSLDESGRCYDGGCEPEQPVDLARQREAIRRLRRRTAQKLRRMGEHSRAAVHEDAAGRM